ncbi:recombinase family protein, partial [Staphylococcus aureus]|uniref:recombinase family protein n=1 Tax=Staphylococcus aureus TaxID=1280 RepID=UPI0037D35B29
MQQLKTKRVGIYVRVSTEMQSTEGYSIDGQINQIKEYCDFHHFEVKDIYADRGISGKSTKIRVPRGPLSSRMITHA